MKIALFHPQLNNYGGGELVCLTIASELSKNHSVTVLTSTKASRKDLAAFFGLNLNKVAFKVRPISKVISKIPSLRSYKSSLNLRYTKDLEKYDLVIDTGTNGWFDKKLRTKTVCYVHFPYFQRKKQGWKSFTNRLLVQPKNAFQYDLVICNSEFTKKHVKKLTRKKICVINPPVEVEDIKSSSKGNIIVSVGRFTREKKHEVMIESFKKLNRKNWELHLIGSFQENVPLYDKSYLEMLKGIAKENPIYFHLNMPHKKVLDFLGHAKIYWHARGYGEKDPNEYENFGITTVEAMAAGCMPIVINKGAQPEIVEHAKNGYVWDNPRKLLQYTEKAIDNEDFRRRIANAAIMRSKRYSLGEFKEKFIDSVRKIIPI